MTVANDVARYDPFKEMVERLFSRSEVPFIGNGSMDEGTLGVDISETTEELIVRASLPGFSKDEVGVQLHQGVLSIKAEHTAVREGAENERYHRRERPWASVSRRIALPGLVHESEVRAELRDGVLSLRIPIPVAAKPKQIEIG